MYLFGNLRERNKENKPQSVNSNCCAISPKIPRGGGEQELDKDNSVGKGEGAVQLCEE